MSCRPDRLCGIVFCALIVLGGAGGALSQQLTLNPVVDLDAEMKAGSDLQQSVDRAESPQAATEMLMKAIEHYRIVTNQKPDHYRAHLQWGAALAQLVLLSPPESRSELARQAIQHFKTAAACPDADALVYNQWASLLLDRMYPMTDRARVPQLLQEAERVLRQGVALAAGTPVNGFLKAQLAHCLILATESGPQDATALETIYRECVELFEAEGVARILDQAPAFAQSYGVALLKYGILKQDKEFLERAIKPLQRILGRQAHNSIARYNLACVYAQLSQYKDAMVHLRLAVEQDKKGAILAAARTDVDLAGLREQPEFKKLIEESEIAFHKHQTMQLVASGQAELMIAHRTNDLAVIQAKLETASGYFRQAIELKPDSYLANYLWGLTVGEMTLHEKDRNKRRELSIRARELFRKAADSPEAESGVFESWSRMIIGGHYNEFDKTSDQLATLYEAKQACERGIKVARFSGDIARLQSQLGLANVNIGLLETSEDVRRAVYRAAITNFEAATRVEKLTTDARLHSTWGIALLKLGQLTQNTLMLRQATEQFQTSLDHDPENLVARYNLACVYALLEQPENSVRHLKVCLAKDPNGMYRTAALTDPDLNAIRHTDVFKHAVGAKPKLDTLTRPRISN